MSIAESWEQVFRKLLESLLQSHIVKSVQTCGDLLQQAMSLAGSWEQVF